LPATDHEPAAHHQARWGDGAAPADEPVVVVAHGDLDCATAAALSDMVDAVLATGARVVVDLSDVPFVDSSGLTMLLVLQRRALELGSTVAIRRPRRQAVNLLEVTGVERVLPVVD
jgi:anti-sigma B factor antagonist